VVVLAGTTACDSSNTTLRKDGCNEAVIDETSPPSDAGSAGNARAEMEAMSGTWTTDEGDVFTIAVEGDVVLHYISGVIRPSADGPTSCASETFVLATAHVTLRTADGRLDEATDVQIKMLRGQVQFDVVLAPSALHGTLPKNPPFPLSGVDISGVYDMQPLVGNSPWWIVSAMANGKPMPDGNVFVTESVTVDTGGPYKHLGEPSGDGGSGK
jgi:hypothetical protein